MTERPMPLEEAFLLLTGLAYTPWPPKEEPMDQMAEDYSRYMRAKRLFDDARLALDALLKDEDSLTKLSAGLEGYAVILEEKFKERADHMVAVWD